jgi:two-component sensor histidine kinase
MNSFRRIIPFLLGIGLCTFKLPDISGPLPHKPFHPVRPMSVGEVSRRQLNRDYKVDEASSDPDEQSTGFTRELDLRLRIYSKDLDRFRKAGNIKDQASTLEAIAQMHQLQGNQRLALEELEEALALNRSIHNPSLHRTYALLSALYRTLGNYPEALRYGLAALKNSQDNHDKDNRSFYYLELGYLYHDLNQPNDALESCEKALQYISKKDPDKDAFNALSLAVNVLLEQNRTTEALLNIEKFVKATPPRSLRSVAMVTLFKAQCYIALKRYPLAGKQIALAEKYLSVIERSADPVFQNESYRMGVYQVAGELYTATREYSKARRYFDKMVQVNKTVNYLSEAVLHQLLLSRLDSAQGNFRDALMHHHRYSFLKDSIFNEARSRQIAGFQIQYETQAKVQRIELLTRENEVQQALLKQKDFQQSVFIVGTILLLVLLVLVYNRFHVKKENNRLLESKQQEINRKNESLRHLLEEKESLISNKDVLLEEKGWLLKEVHHRVKNNLQIVSSLLNSQAAYLDEGKALAAIVDTQHRVHAMSLIHQKLYQSHQISTVAIDEYLKELIDHLCDSYSIGGRIRFQLEIVPVNMDVVIAIPLGLLVNEAVTNCIKYAFPDQRNGNVRLSLKAVGTSNYLLSIADDGIGAANVSNLSPTRSLGMRLMKGLSKQLRGSLTLDHTNGLTINVLFTPISNSNIHAI